MIKLLKTIKEYREIKWGFMLFFFFFHLARRRRQTIIKRDPHTSKEWKLKLRRAQKNVYRGYHSLKPSERLPMQSGSLAAEEQPRNFALHSSWEYTVLHRSTSLNCYQCYPTILICRLVGPWGRMLCQRHQRFAFECPVVRHSQIRICPQEVEKEGKMV